jgi:hypothetical protein
VQNVLASFLPDWREGDRVGSQLPNGELQFCLKKEREREREKKKKKKTAKNVQLGVGKMELNFFPLFFFFFSKVE